MDSGDWVSRIRLLLCGTLPQLDDGAAAFPAGRGDHLWSYIWSVLGF
jgi:hypothetical protein